MIRTVQAVRQSFGHTRRFRNTPRSMAMAADEGGSRTTYREIEGKNPHPNIDIELFTAATPNGHKISIALEELGVPYRTTRIDLTAKEQFQPGFAAISPNGKIPVIRDHAAAGRCVFESGTILQYLAEKTGRLLPQDESGRWDVLQWTQWQMANLGPMLGQCITFERFMPERIGPAIDRYAAESRRLLEVMEQRLASESSGVFLCGDELTIADIAAFPWVRAHRMARVPLDGLPHVEAWLAMLKQRPAFRRGLMNGFPDTEEGRALAARYANDQRMTEEQKKKFQSGGSKFLHESSSQTSKL